MSKGRFITVEGVEGAGKTTCLNLLKAAIEACGIELVVTREPGGTQLGEELRELLLGHKHTGMSDDAELLMMFAARAEHLKQKIEPALNSGKWVLCDRFTDATYAYQGGGRELGMQRIADLETWVQGDRRPDMTVLMDLPVEQGLERAGKRSQPDRFESEALAFFERVRTAYLAIASAQPERVKTVNASRTLDEVSASVSEVIEEYLDHVRA